MDSGVCYGSTDLDLAEDPAVAAARLLPLLPESFLLVSSPLRRCLALARAISPEPRPDARLQEMHFGRWEGRAWDHIHRDEAQALDLWAKDVANAAPHGGETARELQGRALAAIADLQSEGADAVVLVTHGGVLKSLLGHWLELPPERWSRLHFDFAGVSRVCLGQLGPQVRWLNRV